MNGALFSSKRKDWRTPEWLWRKLDDEFGFTVDLCASEENHLCEKYYSETNDGLEAILDGETVFCNPPYGRQETAMWVKKCAESGTTCVMLIPARTDTKWFHEHIYGKAEIRFLQGRLKFDGGGGDAPFPSMVVIFRQKEKTPEAL